MAATPNRQKELRDPAQAGLERQIYELRRRLQSAERRAASESMAHEGQAKLAEAMARAARAEARERAALARANAELVALVRSMEAELETYRAEHTAVRGRAFADPRAPRPKGNVVGVAPVRAGGLPASTPGRRRSRFPAVAVAGICLAVLCVATAPYVFGLSRGEDHSTSFGGGGNALSGDTLDVDGRRVRLLEIAAPPPGSSAGRYATRYLQQLIAGQDVRCESDGRRLGDASLARCFIGAVDIGAVMVLSGNAVSR